MFLSGITRTREADLASNIFRGADERLQQKILTELLKTHEFQGETEEVLKGLGELDTLTNEGRLVAFERLHAHFPKKIEFIIDRMNSKRIPEGEDSELIVAFFRLGIEEEKVEAQKLDADFLFLKTQTLEKFKIKWYQPFLGIPRPEIPISEEATIKIQKLLLDQLDEIFPDIKVDFVTEDRVSEKLLAKVDLLYQKGPGEQEFVLKITEFLDHQYNRIRHMYYRYGETFTPDEEIIRRIEIFNLQKFYTEYRARYDTNRAKYDEVTVENIEVLKIVDERGGFSNLYITGTKFGEEMLNVSAGKLGKIRKLFSIKNFVVIILFLIVLIASVLAYLFLSHKI